MRESVRSVRGAGGGGGGALGVSPFEWAEGTSSLTAASYLTGEEELTLQVIMTCIN